jgi:hypothetical protein
MVVFSSSGLWRTVLDATAVVVGVCDDEDDDDESMISDEAESSTELGTGSEREIGGVAIEVELPTAVLGTPPMLDVCATDVGPGVLVVRTVGGPSPWS